MAQFNNSGRTPAVQLSSTLSGIDLPCNKQDILNYARTNGADDNALSMLEGMPDGEYNTMADIERGANRQQ